MKKITFKGYGVLTTDSGLNNRIMSEPFDVGDVRVVLEFSTRDGLAFPAIYEYQENGECLGNNERMTRAGYWRRYEYGYAVNVDALPEYTPDGVRDAIRALYPEIDPAPVFM